MNSCQFKLIHVILCGPDGGPNDGDQIVRLDVLVARLHEITSWMTKTKMEGLSLEQYEKVDTATKSILELL
jgi:hypothetical protein